MPNSISPEVTRVGHIFDGIDDGLPAQAATLTFERERGIKLTVPFLRGSVDEEDQQQLKTRKWFRGPRPALPNTLLFVDDLGVVTLLGLRFAGLSEGIGSIGIARAEAAIFEQPRSYRNDYAIYELISTIDGLKEFASYSPIRIDDSRNEVGKRVTKIELDTNESIEWEADGFLYKIQSNLSWVGDSTDFTIKDSRPFLSTTHPSGVSLSEHLKAQRAIRALLILVFGQPLAWRSHKLLDPEFPVWMLDGSDRGQYPVEVHMESTIGEHYLPVPGIKGLRRASLRASNLGARGLQVWVELYKDSNFRRAVLPAVEVLNGASRFLEPQLMMLAISLDYFGYFRFGDGKRRTLADSIRKCIEEVGIELPQVGSAQGIARAIAAMNNDLKHPDRQRYPDSDILRGLTLLAKIIVRTQVLDFLNVDDDVRYHFLKYGDALDTIEFFRLNNFYVNDDGVIERFS